MYINCIPVHKSQQQLYWNLAAAGKTIDFNDTSFAMGYILPVVLLVSGKHYCTWCVSCTESVGGYKVNYKSPRLGPGNQT